MYGPIEPASATVTPDTHIIIVEYSVILLILKITMLFASFLAAAFGITAPNTSLATTPTGYFGGNAAHRDNASIAMLAKNRVIMM